ncbi:hybrid sensor histidine kinase/response regulator [Vibrio rhodolitus]|uniref:hybrid sensor histidine kinase/response regulator n=1 Tax=Vibrio rhodolitus TaxID=2231649 RepID=UPI001FC9B1AF|nr:hybrid sensor histidine kinase/response regulator [Vibrio rhodolitus]
MMIDSVLHPIFVLLLGVASVVAGWIIYFIRSTRLSYSGFDHRIGTPYLLYSTSLLLWVLSNAFFYSPYITRVSESLAVSMALFANLASFSAFVFACLITRALVWELESAFTKYLQNILLFSTTLLAIYFNYVPGDTVTGITIAEIGHFQIHFGPQTKWFLGSIIILLGLTLHNIILYSRKARALQQVKSMYMLSGICIFMFATILLNGLIPLLWHDFSLTWLPPAFAISEMLLIGYALLTSRFYSNRYVMHKLLSIVLTCSLIIALISPLVGSLASYGFTFAVIVTCVVTGLLWTRLLSVVSRYTSQMIFGQKHTPDSHIRQLGGEFQKSTSHAFSQIAQTLGIEKNDLQLVSNLQDEKLYTSQLYQQESVLIFEEIEDYVLSNAAVGKVLKKIYFRMKSEQVSLVLPIFDYNNKMSHLLLAKNKRNGSIYFYEEVRALQHVLVQAQGYINADRKMHQSQALANSIAHEMRNPLAQVQLQFELLSSKLQQNVAREELEYELNRGKAAVTRGTQLIDIILREVNEASLEQEPTCEMSIHQAVEQAIDRYAFDSEKIRQRIDIDIATNFSAKVNETLFNFVVFNLLRNSIYYFDSHPDSKIKITTLVGKYENFLIVRDTGPGIPSSLLNRIFDDFFTYNKAGGSGLGLGYCRRVMKSFGGSIQCYSTLGEYTEFHLSFPAGVLSSAAPALPDSEEGEPLTPPLQSLNNQTRKLTVMVVDDKEIQRQLVKLLLGQLGYKVVLANNGQVAVDMLEECSIDFVFMDVQMPVMNGFEAASIIKASHPTLPIYALSGEAGLVELEKIRQTMDGRLTKPTTKLALQQAIESAFS